MLISYISYTCWSRKRGCSTGMQLAGDETPAGPAMCSDSFAIGSRCHTFEPSGMCCSDRTVLELVLDGLPPREREGVRSRNGLPPNGPWMEVYVVSSEDVKADIADYEWCLRTLVTMEAPGEAEQGQMQRVPRVTYIREIICECLEPLHHDLPEVFDMTRMAFYDSGERALLKDRITSLLAALYACQTLSMNSVELRAYLDRKRKTKQQRQRTRVLVEMVERYKNTFACVWGGERHPLRTAVGACQRW